MWEPPQALMFSLFENVCARMGQSKEIQRSGTTEQSWHGLIFAASLGQPFASTIPLEPHGSPPGVVLFTALDGVESKLRDARQLFQGKPVTKHTIKDFKLEYA